VGDGVGVENFFLGVGVANFFGSVGVANFFFLGRGKFFFFCGRFRGVRVGVANFFWALFIPLQGYNDFIQKLATQLRRRFPTS